MRSVWLILPFFYLQVQAQVPRNALGFYEYASNITISMSGDLLKQKATKFFNQPFLVHWDSIAAPIVENNTTIVRAQGYIEVGTPHRIFTGRHMAISLQLCIEIKNGSYHYSFRDFVVKETENAASFPLEHKPDTLKPLVYDRLIRKTHARISYVIGWMKRYMEE
jgi:hypothetical protein